MLEVTPSVRWPQPLTQSAEAELFILAAETTVLTAFDQFRDAATMWLVDFD